MASHVLHLALGFNLLGLERKFRKPALDTKPGVFFLATLAGPKFRPEGGGGEILPFAEMNIVYFALLV